MREHQLHIIPATRLIYGQPAAIWLGPLFEPAAFAFPTHTPPSLHKYRTTARADTLTTPRAVLTDP